MRTRRDRFTDPTRPLAYPTPLRRDIVCKLITPDGEIYYRTRASWAALGKAPRPDAEGWSVPFIPTCEANLHIRSMKLYREDVVEDIASPLFLPPTLPPSESKPKENPFADVVGAVPPITKCKPSRRGYRRYPRKKLTVQIIDSDRNRDIGFTADAANQGWEGRGDLEGRDNSVDVKDNVGRDNSVQVDNNVIRIYSFGPDGRWEFQGLDGDLSNYVPGGDDKDIASYARGKGGRVGLLVPTTTRSLTRQERRLLKVLQYREKKTSTRRIAQLMHLPETTVRALLGELNERGVSQERDFTRDESGKFVKQQ